MKMLNINVSNWHPKQIELMQNGKKKNSIQKNQHFVNHCENTNSAGVSVTNDRQNKKKQTKKNTLLTMNLNEKPKNHFPYKPQLRHHRW